MAKSKAKPLSFSTTIRNPERIPDFLKCILPFENQILSSDIIHKVIKTIIREKYYTPVYIKSVPELNRISKNTEAYFSDEQLEEIIASAQQKHKESGFKAGWDSRFDTWYKLIKEFGFIKYSMNEPIVITTTGHMLVDAYLEEPSNYKKIQKVFLNALMKYQTNNPLRKNLNDNVPLPFLLKVIQYFHNDPEENNAGIARHELPILICWRDNDAYSAYMYIKNIRKSFGFNCSDEFIYEKCLEILEDNNKTYLKIEKICHESVDEYIRKMRMSGLLSLRGNGRFLDINSFEKETVDYVIDNYMVYPKFEDANSYIDYMGSIDLNILKIEINPVNHLLDIKKKTLYKFASDISKERIQKELKLVCNKRESHHNILRLINASTRLEFLISIALVQNFQGLDVNPNYSVDDEGFPIFTASGGYADIECYDVDYDSYFEVTLMRGRSDQVNNEIIPISRHLRDVKEKRRQESFSVLVAPIIHQDTIEAAEWQKIKNNVDILTYNINEFIEIIGNKDKVSQLLTD